MKDAHERKCLKEEVLPGQNYAWRGNFEYDEHCWAQVGPAPLPLAFVTSAPSKPPLDF